MYKLPLIQSPTAIKAARVAAAAKASTHLDWEHNRVVVNIAATPWPSRINRKRIVASSAAGEA
jgi:hypothetical protein